MSTGNSPLRVLKMQADKMAKNIKAIERGEVVVKDPDGTNMLANDTVKFGIVMDDRVITMEISWKKIRETSEVSLAAYILKLTKNVRDTHH